MNKPGAWREKLLVAVVAVLTAGLLAGCLNVNADVGPLVGNHSRSGNAKRIDKSEAVRVARRVVRNSGCNPDDYKVRDKKADNGYWVLFDHKKHGNRTGYPYHMAVRVPETGGATLFRTK